MTRFVVNRLAGMLLVLFGVCLFTYMVFFLLSPDPAVQICGKNCTPERIDQIRENLGLTDPFVTQFWNFLSGWWPGAPTAAGSSAPPPAWATRSRPPSWSPT